MIFQAHKGVSTENPENTMPALEAAVRQGYGIIELDVGVTKDQKFVLLHNLTINKTARFDNGDELLQPLQIADITYAEALNYDFGLWFSEKFRGTKIPLFEDVLKFAAKNNIKLKIDNKYERFTEEQKAAFFELIQPYEAIACLTCFSIDSLKKALRFFPNMHFHYDGPVTREILEQLGTLLPKEQLTVWLPLQCPATAWVKVEFATKESASLIKQYARLGLWILSTNAQLQEAERLGADIVETNGQLKPTLNKGILADMHTHSESSHDSVCRIEAMAAAQAENGTKLFAVTDHFDTDSYTDYDVFTPMQKAYQTTKELNAKNKNGQRILSGIEISEGFWHPEQYQKAHNLAPYDVIIGSVHLVKYAPLTHAYSKIDFSKLSKETVLQFLDAYFDDILTMLETTDFDILAHLTCPLRYINGKYNFGIDISCYESKIEEILMRIIKKGIALEVNTSAYEVLNDFMPSAEILKKYYAMGGYLITLGSDAHIAKDAAMHFDNAIQTLKTVGFSNIFYYKNRKPMQITI